MTHHVFLISELCELAHCDEILFIVENVVALIIEMHVS